MSGCYFQVSLKNVPQVVEEQVTSLCFEHGALGVSENLDFDKKVYPKPEIIEKKFKTLDIYFKSKPQEFISDLQKNFPAIDAEISEQETKDWLAEWKKGFHAFQLTNHFWVVPSWEKAPEDVEPIFIDPGMAFGTGTHETTKICSELIVEACHGQKTNSMIDVGTGTGILAFLGHKLGIPRILGTDNDLEAVRVAQENAQKNVQKNDAVEFSSKDLPMIKEQFDLVVANIIDGVLLKLKPFLVQKRNNGASVILSGILQENDSEFIESFLKDTSLKVIQRTQKGEWVGYLLN